MAERGKDDDCQVPTDAPACGG